MEKADKKVYKIDNYSFKNQRTYGKEKKIGIKSKKTFKMQKLMIIKKKINQILRINQRKRQNECKPTYYYIINK